LHDVHFATLSAAGVSLVVLTVMYASGVIVTVYYGAIMVLAV